MIYKKTKLHVVDNSGASLGKCIHVFKKGKNVTFAQVGHLIKITIKRLKKSIPKKKVKKSDVVLALIVSTCNNILRKNGVLVKFNDNFAVLVNKESNNIISNRITKPVSLEIRDTAFSKLISLSPNIL